jgi:hypothetical protein
MRELMGMLGWLCAGLVLLLFAAEVMQPNDQ